VQTIKDEHFIVCAPRQLLLGTINNGGRDGQEIYYAESGDTATLNVGKSWKNVLRCRWEITLNGP